MKALIVDDEIVTRMLLSQVLERLPIDNLQILTAEDGESAMHLIHQERPELIVLDLLLPKMNGYDVCRQLRRIPAYNPYVIILTARGRTGTDRQQAEDIGANVFMTKPFHPTKLIEHLRQVFNLYE